MLGGLRARPNEIKAWSSRPIIDKVTNEDVLRKIKESKQILNAEWQRNIVQWDTKAYCMIPLMEEWMVSQQEERECVQDYHCTGLIIISLYIPVPLREDYRVHSTHYLMVMPHSSEQLKKGMDEDTLGSVSTLFRWGGHFCHVCVKHFFLLTTV